MNYFLLRALLPFLSRYFADLPNSRSSHSIAKARGGGVVFLITTLFIIVFSRSYYLLFFVPLAVVSFLDDRYSISSLVRYLIQFLTVYFIIFYFNPIFNSTLNLFSFINFPYLVFFLLLGTSLINFINFMDGIDGLVAGCMIVIFASLSTSLGLPLYPLISSLAAFLYFNWSPSKVFMGDIGSTFLGALYFAVLIQSDSTANFISILLISSPLTLDAIFTLLARLFNRENIFSPHRKHLYQRLVLAGKSHSFTASLYIFSTVILSISYHFLEYKYLILIVLSMLLLGLYLNKYIASSFY